jgi:hypothetical protein
MTFRVFLLSGKNESPPLEICSTFLTPVFDFVLIEAQMTRLLARVTIWKAPPALHNE